MKIETNSSILQRYQIVLAHLGYYSGKLDGIWAGSTIQAKRDFETSGNFNPGIPNQGLPFVAGMPLPKGVFVDPNHVGFITCRGLKPEVIEELIQSRGEHTGKAVVKDVAKINVEAPSIEKIEEHPNKAEETSGVTTTEQSVKPKQKPNHNQRHRQN